MLYRKRFVHQTSARLPQCHAATIVELADGALLSAWVAGAYEKANDVAIYGATLLPGAEEWTLRVEEGGKNWQMSNPIRTPSGVIQPTLAPLRDGRLLMYLRTYEREEGTLWRAFSSDDGRLWSVPERAPLPNPNSRVDLAWLSSGRLALAFNDTPHGRTPLTLALSEDEG